MHVPWNKSFNPVLLLFLLSVLVFAVGLRDYAWTSRYNVLYIDNPVRMTLFFPHTKSHRWNTGSKLAVFKCDYLQTSHWGSVFLFCFLSRGGNRVQLHRRWQRFCSEPGWRWQRPVQVKHRPPPYTPSSCHFNCSHCFNFTSIACVFFPFQSALTQFFQIFPEYQSNEFYATGEVCFTIFYFLFSNFINPFWSCFFKICHIHVYLCSNVVVRWQVCSCHILLHP